ncbi:MAG: LysR family transcriptional regulator [Bdellovibrionales bacterium RIFCSPHIGHO2_01_FULL_40_29]|nr:MAG: LysR family transcriptional regulator [Bdellovibrionales bacterium RIFCSPHIGHO2_01_FULL_40_29]OFZ35076.1 MAG: LysR family transcriptional regulator [Bdellovibrionales bacterium RIFCSPHIGHO2_02_FULL_40_15]
MSLLSPTLEAFWAVVRKGTVQDASKILGLTQTGVTQRIRSLEKQLKTTLFIRSRKGMKLTTEGEALLQFVKSSLDIEGMALSKIQRAAKDSIIEVSICGPSSVLRSRVIPILNPILKDYPLLRFRYDLSDVDSNTDKLKTGDCDLALLELHHVTREMDSKILRAERYCLYGPASWKRRLLSDILQNETIVDFDSKDPMTFNLLEKYKLKAKARTERHYANNTDALASMVIAGVGYSVLSEQFAEPLVKKNQLIKLASDYFYDFKVALAWYPRHEMPEYFRAIVKALH